MSLHDLLSSTNEGRRGLASARLRYDVIGALHKALLASGMSQADLASSLGIRRSAVNAVFRGTGNLRVNTIAEYLHELGMEGRLVFQPCGQAREETQTWRQTAVASGPKPAREAALEAKLHDWVVAASGSLIKVTAAAPLKRDEFTTAA